MYTRRIEALTQVILLICKHPIGFAETWMEVIRRMGLKYALLLSEIASACLAPQTTCKSLSLLI
jgi:hypothetical protein